MQKYLLPTRMLDYHHASIQTLVQSRCWLVMSERERTQSIYRFVRDEILFGYNIDDAIPASCVLSDGYGQCNTKGTLFMALLRACHIPCRVHGFTIDKHLQYGAMTGLVYRKAPNNVFHSWVEVWQDGRWYELEGFILDSLYLRALQHRFLPNADGSFCGYGVAISDFMNPPIDFNCCNTYIQRDGINQDFGVFDSPDELFSSHQQDMHGLKRFAYRHLGRHIMNHNVNRIRHSLIYSVTHE